MTSRTRFALGALIGILAAGVAVGVGELAAAFVRPAASPIIVVGNRFILLTPESVRRWAIRVFGTNDKDALLTGIYVFIVIFAVVVGVLTVVRLWMGLLGIAFFGVVGVYCALTTHAHQVGDVVPTLIATVAGVVALSWLAWKAFGVDAMAAERLPPLRAGGSSSKAAPGWPARRCSPVSAADRCRTRVSTRRRPGRRSRCRLQRPSRRRARHRSRAASTSARAGCRSSTPNQSFYRIDTALSVPQIDPDKWSLRIHGLVDREVTLNYKELLARPLIERWITMACVSNEVGGDLIGNALFLGARFADVLSEAGVHAGADQLVLRSSDGMTIGTPTAVVMDGRDALLAVGMNGVPLPIEHGFPVRVVVPGLYGYVSACKWVVDIEATTFKSSSAYWVDEGWIPKAPILLSSRIDRPVASQLFKVGDTVAIAGVAWEQHVGVSGVEVQIDDGPWTTARLAAVPSVDTWRQWVLAWTAVAGTHSVRVRAIDADGKVQIATDAEPYPGASTGYHTIRITVR